MARTAATERAAVAASRCKAADDKKSDTLERKQFTFCQKNWQNDYPFCLRFEQYIWQNVRKTSIVLHNYWRIVEIIDEL